MTLSVNVGILQFPGSNCDFDTLHAFQDVIGVSAKLVWHKETDLKGFDAVVVPGGFSYGDYLRCGAIARFSPVMKALLDFAQAGKPVLGICNGFQILCEAGLLPGALVRNSGLEFICKTTPLCVHDAGAVFNPSSIGAKEIALPVAHGEGNYRIDDAGLSKLKANGQILLTYAGENINGSVESIAGIRNEAGNVFGMMPHPERAVEPFMPTLDGITVLNVFLSAATVSA